VVAVIVGAAVLMKPATPAAPAPPPPPTQADRVAALRGDVDKAYANHQYAIAAATYEAVVKLSPGDATAQASLAKAKSADAEQAIVEEATKLVASKVCYGIEPIRGTPRLASVRNRL